MKYLKWFILALFLVFIVVFFLLRNSNASKVISESEIKKLNLIDEDEIKKNISFEIIPDSFTNPYGEISDSYCLSVAKGINIEQQLVQKRDAIIAIIDDSIKYGISHDSLDHSSINSGVGLFRSRWLRNKLQGTLISPYYHVGKWIRAEVLESIQVEQLINSGDIEKLLQMMNLGKIKHNVYYSLTDGKLLNLFSYILHENKEIDKSEIEEIVNAGVVPTDSDMGYLTAENWGTSILEYLYYSSNVDAKIIFKNKKIYKSFASISLEAGNFNNVLFWYNLGSSLDPDPIGLNVARNLLNNKNKYTEEEINKLVNLIVTEPLTQDASEIIIKEFGQTPEIISKISIIQNADVMLNQQEIEKSFTLTEQILRTVFEGVSSFTKEANKKCYFISGKYLTDKIMSKSPNNIHSTKNKNSEKISDENLLNSMAKITLSENDRKIYDSALNKKLDYDDKFLAETKDKIIEIKKALKKDAQLQELDRIMQEIFRLAQAGEWDQALSLFESIEVKNQDALNALVLIAISTSSTFEQIRALLEMGGKLPINSISMLITNDNVNLAKKLVPYGLDLTFSASSGGNSVKDAVKLGSIQMLRFLVDNQVPVNTPYKGLDALHIALQKFKFDGKRDEYIEVILNAGAIVDESHLAIMQNIAMTDPLSYAYLVERFPMLEL